MSRAVRFVLLLAALLLHSGASRAAERYAVLVGVGKYDPATVVPGKDSIDLKGPPNDLVLMQEMLSYYGFNDGNTKVLADAEATRQGIIDAVKRHLLSLPGGSLAVLYFSGHGSALKSDGQGESNDETIVPYDGRIGGQPPRDIVDDEMYGWIEALNGKGITAVFILDSCFSGGGARLGIADETKTIPAASAPSRGDRDGVFSLRSGGVPGRGGAVAILTASEAHEPSRSSLTSRGHLGVFTAALRDALLPDEKVAPPARWGEAMDRVAAALKPDPRAAALQTPRMFGNRDAPIFDSEGPFSNSVKAERVAADRATMSAGSDLGVTEGSVFKLFGNGRVPWVSSPDFEARAKVTSLTATSAELEVLDGRQLTSEVLAAVEFEYVIPGRKIRVAVPPRGKISPFDRKAIVDGLGNFADLSEGAAELKVTLQNGQWTLATADGREVGGSFPSGKSELLRSEMSVRFNNYARWMRLVDWKRRGAGVAAQVRYRLLVETPTGPKLIDGAHIAATKIPAGSKLQLFVESREPRKVRIDVLLLRPNFTVGWCPLGPAGRNQELSTEPVELSAQAGAAAWKIIVSDQAQNLSFAFLASDGARAARTASLEDEFARVWNGVGARPRAAPDGRSFWKTLDVPFQVTEAPVAASIPASPKRCFGVGEK
ncbi:caspase family protein [Starkeya sp. ORNL1]|uniref:caspase family protein n=1 Tax=Starkeya sp. ORNL1 TaxID=2709380 RepID=UPI0014637F2E|nr:caspase family protein [Starkeya sp. ORNL1]QJP14611.1 caspase family protein [Starkeya sp. ORNL1]